MNRAAGVSEGAPIGADSVAWGWGPGPRSDEPRNAAPPEGWRHRAEAFEAGKDSNVLRSAARRGGTAMRRWLGAEEDPNAAARYGAKREEPWKSARGFAYWRTLLAGLLATILVGSACGSETDSRSAPVTAAIATPGLPYVYTGPDGVSSTVDSAARIVTLSGDFSEIIASLGLADNLVGVDLSSDFPAEVMQSKPKVGVEFRLFAEPILDLDPTVVIGDIDARPPEVIEQVRAAGVPVVIVPRLVGVDAPAEKIRLVAQILGIGDAGGGLADSVQAEIDAALARVAGAVSRPRVAVVYIATQDQVLLFGDNTVFEGLLAAVGAEDVGPRAGVDGFVPLTAEAIVAAAPDVIITARRGFDDRGGLEAFLDLPGIAQTPAAATGSVLVYDDSFLLSLGPRSGRLLDLIISDLHPDLALP